MGGKKEGLKSYTRSVKAGERKGVDNWGEDGGRKKK